MNDSTSSAPTVSQSQQQSSNPNNPIDAVPESGSKPNTLDPQPRTRTDINPLPTRGTPHP